MTCIISNVAYREDGIRLSTKLFLSKHLDKILVQCRLIIKLFIWSSEILIIMILL